MSVELIPPRQLTEVKDYVADDWTGVSDLQERRKRQNRLSKRAQRKRSAATKHQLDADSQTTHRNNSNSDHDPNPGNPSSLFSALKSPNKLSVTDPSPINPNFRIWFPLPADHLLTLIQFNVYRATWMNLALVTPAAIKPTSDYLSEMNIFADPISLPYHMPPSLTPTLLQRQIRHPAWIDAVPSASLRDSLIVATGTYDEDDFCFDILGGLFEIYFEDGKGRRGEAGVMVWADPWDVKGWEMSGGFVGKWGFLVRGCLEMLDATNCWRRRRGEELLSFDDSL